MFHLPKILVCCKRGGFIFTESVKYRRTLFLRVFPRIKRSDRDGAAGENGSMKREVQKIRSMESGRTGESQKFGVFAFKPLKILCVDQ